MNVFVPTGQVEAQVTLYLEALDAQERMEGAMHPSESSSAATRTRR